MGEGAKRGAHHVLLHWTLRLSEHRPEQNGWRKTDHFWPRAQPSTGKIILRVVLVVAVPTIVVTLRDDP